MLARENQRGITTLTYAASVLGALGFISLYFNLMNYIAARSAAEAAATAVVRCLTPTDAGCLLAEDVPLAPPPNWFGYEADSGAEESLNTWLDNTTYEGRVNRREYRADYVTHEGVLETPAIEYQTYLAQPTRFRAVVGGLKEGSILQPFATGGFVAGVFERITYLYTPKGAITQQFPSFESDLSNKAENWVNSRREVNFSIRDAGEKVITGEHSVVFSSGMISVPPLPGSPSEGTCSDRNGRNCDVTVLAGEDQPNREAWKEYAYISLKAFARVRAVGSQDARVKWSQAPNAPGLFIHINHGDGNSELVCLGGRVESKRLPSGGDWTNYNMWTRGPNNSTGGTNAICPGGNTIHDKLKIKRGGSFEILGYLRNRPGMGDTQAQVTFAYFFDDYDVEIVTQSEERNCGAIARVTSGGMVSWECLFEDECAHLDPDDKSNCRVIFLDHPTIQTDCSGPMVDTRYTRDVLACQEEWMLDPGGQIASAHPEQFPGLSEELARMQAQLSSVDVTVVPKLCGFKAETSPLPPVEIAGYSPVRDIDGRDLCHNITPNPVEKTSCQRGPKGSIGREECNSFADTNARLQSLQQNAQDLIFRQFGQDSLQLTEPNLRLQTDPSTYQTVSFWGLPDPEMFPELRTIQHSTQTPLVVYEKTRADGQRYFDAVTIADFLPIIRGEQADIRAGWDFYQENAGDYVRLQLTSQEPHILTVTQDPFDRERDFVLPGTEGGFYDFDLDGATDSECSGASEKTIEELVRSEAVAQGIAEGLVRENGQYIIPMSIQKDNAPLRYIGEVAGESKQSLGLNDCAPTITSRTQTDFDTMERVSLGASYELPAGCASGEYINCFQEASETSFDLTDPELNSDLAAAIARGRAEVESFYPGSRLAERCAADEEQCYQITIDDSDYERAKVQVSYQVPLFFPLDQLLEARTVTVHASKQQIRQIVTIR